jgi:glycosyltransferase involved in cell wall biosynthesis
VFHLRVLMVSKALVVGAYHTKLTEIARQGVELTVVIPEGWGAQQAELTEGDGYRVRVLPCVRSGKFSHFYPNFVEIVRKSGADLLHLDEEPFSPVAFEVILAARLRRTPALFFTWQNLFEAYPWYYNFFERHTFRHVRGAVAGNEEAREVLIKRGFGKPIWVIPQFGVDPTIFKKSDAGELRRELKLEGKFVAGFMGRLVEEKGVDTLLAALSRLPVDVTAVVVGSGPFQGRLEKLCREFGLAERVRWVPYVASHGVPKYLNAFDVLALPSKTLPKWKEQFGRVLIEAMACEVPVIGSDSGEIPRVIGDCGYSFSEGDASALAALLDKLRKDVGLRSKLGSQGRARVLAHFTQAEIARQTVEVYNRILSDDSPE